MTATSRTNHCAAVYTRYDGQWYQASTYVVGVPCADRDDWRTACTQHLPKVVAERIASLSTNGAVAVAKVNRDRAVAR